VTLTATDGDGLSGADTITIMVTSKTPPPTDFPIYLPMIVH